MWGSFSIGSCATRISLHSEHILPSVRPASEQVDSTAARVTSVWGSLLTVSCGVVTVPQAEHLTPAVRPVAEQVGSTASRTMSFLWAAGVPTVSLQVKQVLGAVQVASRQLWPSAVPSTAPHLLQVEGVVQVATVISWPRASPSVSPHEHFAGDSHVAAAKSCSCFLAQPTNASKRISVTSNNKETFFIVFSPFFILRL